MRKNLLFVVIFVLSLLSCSKDESVVTKNEPTSSSNHEQTTGKNMVKVHPYNLDNIMAAQRELGGTLKSANEMTLYKYVTFYPDTIEMKILLQDSTIKLYDIPLANPELYSWKNNRDLKSALLGDTTRKQWYAILPLDKIIPNNITYAILDTLYFPDYEKETDLYFAAHILAGTIKVDSAAVDSMYATSSNLKAALGWSWFKKAVNWAKNAIKGYEPDGVVTMNSQPVEGVQVEVIAWGLPYSGQTNALGEFHISKKIHVWSVVYLTFENNHCNLKLWNLEKWYSLNNIMGTARYYVGDKAASDMEDLKIQLDNKSWGGLCATVINAVEKYHRKASELYIGLPPKVNIAIIWGKKYSQGSGSTPMLNWLLNPVSPSEYFGSFLKPLLSLTNEHFNPFASLLPDIILPEESGFDYEKTTSTTLHELTHAAHAWKSGRIFWSRVVTGELNNVRNFKEPYGKRTSEFAGAVGLAEAWANDVENLMMYYWFGKQWKYIDFYMENWFYKSYKDSINDWVPYGLFYDLWDNDGTYGVYEDKWRKEPITDNVSGITYSELFSNFGGAEDNLLEYKKRLKSKYPNIATKIETLFNQYGF